MKPVSAPSGLMAGGIDEIGAVGRNATGEKYRSLGGWAGDGGKGDVGWGAVVEAAGICTGSGTLLGSL